MEKQLRKKPIYATKDLIDAVTTLKRLCDMVYAPEEGRKIIIPCHTGAPPNQMILGFELIFEEVKE